MLCQSHFDASLSTRSVFAKKGVLPVDLVVPWPVDLVVAWPVDLVVPWAAQNELEQLGTPPAAVTPLCSATISGHQRQQLLSGSVPHPAPGTPGA